MQLLSLPDGSFLVSLLQKVERRHFFVLIRDQTLAFEPILNALKLAAGRAEIHQYLRAHPAQLWNAIQHGKQSWKVIVCLLDS
jgi:hypothetical protein